MSKGYLKIMVLSVLNAFILVGHGLFIAQQEPSWSLYAHYGLVAIFAYSQWWLLADAKARFVTPFAMFYTFTMTYASQYSITYVSDEAAFFMSAASVFCGYAYYAVCRALSVSKEETPNPQKRLQSYVFWNAKSAIAILAYGLSYIAFANDVGVVISTAWTLVFATLMMIKYYGIYRGQSKTLEYATGNNITFICRASIVITCAFFLINMLETVYFASLKSAFELTGSMVSLSFLLLASLTALWSSDTD